MKHWLITYSHAARIDRRPLVENTATDSHPADWLINVKSRYPDEDIKLLFAMEIDERQYKTIGARP